MTKIEYEALEMQMIKDEKLIKVLEKLEKLLDNELKKIESEEKEK